MSEFLDASLRDLLTTFGAQRVRDALGRLLAPIPDDQLSLLEAPAEPLRFSSADDPPTARSAGDRHESSDPRSFGRSSIKGELLVWAAGLDRELDRDEALRWWLEHREPEAEHSRIESVRRRFDELVQIGFLVERDLSGQVRRVAVSVDGHTAARALAQAS